MPLLSTLKAIYAFSIALFSYQLRVIAYHILRLEKDVFSPKLIRSWAHVGLAGRIFLFITARDLDHWIHSLTKKN